MATTAGHLLLINVRLVCRLIVLLSGIGVPVHASYLKISWKFHLQSRVGRCSPVYKVLDLVRSLYSKADIQLDAEQCRGSDGVFARIPTSYLSLSNPFVRYLSYMSQYY